MLELLQFYASPFWVAFGLAFGLTIVVSAVFRA